MRHIAVLSAFLLAGAISTFASVDTGLLALVPPGAKIIGAVDVTRSRNSDFGQYLLAKAQAEDAHSNQAHRDRLGNRTCPPGTRSGADGHLPRLASRPDGRGPGPHPGIVAPATHCVSAVPSVVTAEPGIRSYLDLPPYAGRAAAHLRALR